MEKIALIVGGMGGISQATAEALAKKGYAIILLYHSSPMHDVESFLKTLEGNGHRAHAWNAREPEKIHGIIASLPRLDLVLYTPADMIVRATMESMGLDRFEAQFTTTLFGAFAVFAASMPLLKRSGGGLILGVTTSFIEPGNKAPRLAGYISAKFALRGLLREISEEGLSHGIRVNAIAPDLMQTKFSNDLPERYFEFAAERDPRGRITTPEDVAGRIIYLLSGAGKDITNSSISVITGTITPL